MEENVVTTLLLLTLFILLGTFILKNDFSKVEDIWHSYTFGETDKSETNKDRRNRFIIMTGMMSLLLISIGLLMGGIARLLGLQ